LHAWNLAISACDGAGMAYEAEYGEAKLSHRSSMSVFGRRRCVFNLTRQSLIWSTFLMCCWLLTPL
jgi:hypothetical protein